MFLTLYIFTLHSTESSLPATPQYNLSILEDMAVSTQHRILLKTVGANAELRKALVLFKVRYVCAVCICNLPMRSDRKILKMSSIEYLCSCSHQVDEVMLFIPLLLHYLLTQPTSLGTLHTLSTDVAVAERVPVRGGRLRRPQRRPAAGLLASDPQNPRYVYMCWVFILSVSEDRQHICSIFRVFLSTPLHIVYIIQVARRCLRLLRSRRCSPSLPRAPCR